jgi:transcriptional regulator with XRE-family HTH domain
LLELIRDAARTYTQDDLATKTGIPRSTLANFLSPTGDPRVVHVDQMLRIARALGIDARTWVVELEQLQRSADVPVTDEVTAQRAARQARERQVGKPLKRSARKPPKPRADG